jgi:chemotaxis protein methyltransferase CheR
MTDPELVALMQWAAPRLGLRWEGFRRVRSIVRKRVRRRMRALGLEAVAGYRARLEQEPAEWRELEAMCRMPISRFCRDRGVFESLRGELLPGRARAAVREGRDRVRIWSAGCASGEEPYSLAVVWHLEIAPAHPGVRLDLVATDADEGMLARAVRASYPRGSLREMSEPLRERAFDSDGDAQVLRAGMREGVTFRLQDLRREQPEGPFDLVLCRNVAFTYFDHEAQASVAAAIAGRLVPGGLLVVGAHERLPEGATPLVLRARSVYERPLASSPGEKVDR